MPRRGVAHVRGGIGKLAETLVDAVRRQGGQVLFRQRATRVSATDRAKRVETSKGGVSRPTPSFSTCRPGMRPPVGRGCSGQDTKGSAAGRRLGRIHGLRRPGREHPARRFSVAPPGLGPGAARRREQRFSLAQPARRCRPGPAGQRALTISTHTDLRPGGRCSKHDRDAYEARKAEYAERVLDAAQVAIPGLRSAARLVLPGTPVTFQRFTQRSRGWVGGFPQTNLFRAWAPNWVTACGWSATAFSPASRCWRRRWAGHGSRTRC